MEINLPQSKILVTGGAGFLGQSVISKLLARGVAQEQIMVPRSRDCDLRLWENCQKVVAGKDIVIHLAANCGGISYNIENAGKIFFDNISMNTHMIEASRQAGVKKFVSIGSICSYPRQAPMPATIRTANATM